MSCVSYCLFVTVDACIQLFANRKKLNRLVINELKKVQVGNA